MSNETRYPSAPLESQQGQFVQQPDNGHGLWAMWLGIVSLVFFGILTGIPAIILGISGRRKATAGTATNGGQALAGIILGTVAIFLTVLAVAFLVLVRMAAEGVPTT